MGHKFAEIAFTDTVKAFQEERGSRAGYEGMALGEDFNQLLSPVEAEFIAARDSFYMATVSETGWPYVQHRGGPKGFMKVLDAQTIGFADYAGNRQYVSAGNLRTDDRVSLIFMDYPNRRRLKVFGRVKAVSDGDLDALAKLEDNHYRAPVERGFLITIEGFDWNCPKYITPRYTDKEVTALLEPLHMELAQLKAARPAAPQFRELPPAIGNGPLELQIAAVRQEADGIRSYELRAPDGGQLPEVEAGAHLQVPVFSNNGDTVWRYYSICSDPGQRNYYQIAVLDQPDGRGGSSALQRTYQVGQMLGCYRPDNYFGLQKEAHAVGRKAVFIAGGIGITPIRSMVLAAERAGFEYEIHYATKRRRSAAFSEELEKLGRQAHFYFSEEQERMDLNQILTQNEGGAVHYLCGPASMLEAARKVASKLKLAPDALVFEAFDLL